MALALCEAHRQDGQAISQLVLDAVRSCRVVHRPRVCGPRSSYALSSSPCGRVGLLSSCDDLGDLHGAESAGELTCAFKGMTILTCMRFQVLCRGPTTSSHCLLRPHGAVCLRGLIVLSRDAYHLSTQVRRCRHEFQGQGATGTLPRCCLLLLLLLLLLFGPAVR